MSVQVFCSIPGMLAGFINGQEFAQSADPGVLVSVGEVSPENLALFSSVPGYSAENAEQAAVRLLAEADAADVKAIAARAAAVAAVAVVDAAKATGKGKKG